MSISVYLYQPGSYDEFNKAVTYLLYKNDSQDEDFISNGKLKLEVNKAGSFEFDILPSHSCYQMLRRYVHYVMVQEDDNAPLFYGRILSISMEFSGVKHVTCEGLLANLLDCPMYNMTGDVEDLFKITGNWDAYGLIQTAIGAYRNIIRTDIDWLGELGGGADYGSAPFDTIYDSEISLSGSVGDFIMDTLVGTVGGFIHMHYLTEPNGDITGFIEWKRDPTMENYIEPENSQTIVFGENLLDISGEYNGDEISTAIGVEWGDDEKDQSSEEEQQSSDPQYLVTYKQDVDDPSVQIIVPALIGKMGTQCVNVKMKHFNVRSQRDAVNIADDYVDRFCDYDFTDEQFDSLTVRAIDMHYASDEEVKPIRLYDMPLIVSSPHGINRKMLCTAIEMDIDNFSNNSYTFSIYRPTEPSDDKALSRRLGYR